MLVQLLNKMGLATIRKALLSQDLKRIGLILGINHSEPILGGYVTMSSAGIKICEEIDPILSLISEYIQENPSDDMQQVFNIISTRKKEMHLSRAIYEFIAAWNAAPLLNILINPKAYLLRNHTRNNGIVLQQVANNSHIFWLVYNCSYLTVINRGYYTLPEFTGMKIFKTKRNITNELNGLSNIFTCRPQAYQENIIKQLLAEETASFEHKPHKFGNCGFANVKSAIKAILYLLHGEQGLAEYKQFTKWLRDREIIILLRKYLDAQDQQDLVAAALYTTLITKYVKKLELLFTQGKTASLIRRATHMRFISAYAKNLDIEKDTLTILNNFTNSVRNNDPVEINFTEKTTEIKFMRTYTSKLLVTMVALSITASLLPFTSSIILAYIVAILAIEMMIFHYLNNSNVCFFKPKNNTVSAFKSKTFIISNIHTKNNVATSKAKANAASLPNTAINRCLI